ncbi:MAG: hypothetical protein JW802_06505 [Campylobacterales bacterium]|nr:hypothetical protein [Campylobacterales bacterium]MBN2832424.1 hypothetical protein [Campylobacterales bacterium]
MIVDIIHFGMTASAPANYVLDIVFTVLVKGILPFYLVKLVVVKYFK